MATKVARIGPIGDFDSAVIAPAAIRQAREGRTRSRNLSLLLRPEPGL